LPPQKLATARKRPQKLGALLFLRWSCVVRGVAVGLQAFVCQYSGAAKAGGVHGYCSFCAQRLVFGAYLWAVDALTVSASNED
jgi:hypothetical protein